MYRKTIFFLVNDTTLQSNNPSNFRHNLLERLKEVIMTINDEIKDEKLQYDSNR